MTSKNGVFISYRRKDRPMSTGRIYDYLSAKLQEGRVFMDVRNICLGREWLFEIGRKIDDAEILIAVIGPEWLPAGFAPAKDAQSASNEDDFVVLEIEKAAANGIPIVPVLVDGAPLPSAELLPETLKFLPNRQAFSISYDNFLEDASRLLKGLQLSDYPPRNRWKLF